MTNYRYITALHVEGVGDDASKTGGAAFYFGRQTPPSGSYSVAGLGTVELDWIQCITTLPKTLKREIDPITNEYKGIPATFELENSDRVAAIFQRVITRPLFQLSAELGGAAATNVVVNAPSGVADGYSGSVVWVGDEAIKLGSHDAVDTFVGSTRGYYGSKAQNHPPGSNLYAAPPKFPNRICSILRYDVDADTIDVMARGYLAEGSPNAKRPEVVELKIRDLFNVWLGIEVNQHPVNWNASGQLRQIATEAVVGENIRINGAPLQQLTRPLDPTSAQAVGVQVGGSVVRAVQLDANTNKLSTEGDRDAFGSIIGSLRLRSDPLELDELDNRRSGPYPDAAFELFVIDQIPELTIADNLEVSVTKNLEHPYHPGSLAMAVLVSNGKSSSQALFRSLGENWSLSMDIDYIDFAGISELIDESADLDNAIEQLLWGWDGKPVKVFERLRQIMRFHGLFWSTKGPDVSMSRLRVMSLDQFAEADANALTPYKGRFGWGPPQTNKDGVITANVGELPWEAAYPLRVNSSGDSRRSRLLQKTTDALEIETISAAGALDVVPVLSNLANIQAFSFPRIDVEVASRVHSGVDYDLGSWVSFTGLPETRLLADENGDPIKGSNIEGNVKFMGLVVSEATDPLAWTSVLGVLLTNYRAGTFVRHRAPTMVLTSVSSTKYYTYPESQFGADAPDNESFKVGDEVTTWATFGERRNATQVRSVTAIGNDATGDYIQLSAGFSSVSYGDSMIIRAAPSPEFDNTARYSFTARPYAYFAIAGVLYEAGGVPGSPDVYGGVVGWFG